MRKGSCSGGRVPSLKTHRAPSLSRAMPAARSSLDDPREPAVVEALAQRHVVLHPQPAIDGVELALRKADHLLPESEIFGVAVLQQHQLAMHGRERPGILVFARGDQLVEPLHLAQRIAGERLPIQLRLPAVQEHAKLRAPVSEMVVADHRAADEAPDPAEGIAEDGRADVADVHRLGDVGRGEIDHERARSGR